MDCDCKCVIASDSATCGNYGSEHGYRDNQSHKARQNFCFFPSPRSDNANATRNAPIGPTRRIMWCRTGFVSRTYKLATLCKQSLLSDEGQKSYTPTIPMRRVQ